MYVNLTSAGAFVIAVALTLSACSAIGPRTGSSATHLDLECPLSAAIPNARYIGPYRGPDSNLQPKDFAQDLYCATTFKTEHYSHGFVTVYGSSRIGEHNTASDPQINAANDHLYAQIRSFAHHWSERYGNFYPILTGAGPGLMEAASRGASEVGRSIGYRTYYDPNPNPTPAHPYAYFGDPRVALHKYNNTQEIISSGMGICIGRVFGTASMTWPATMPCGLPT